ncbi:unnamed protein product [Rhodiola kirilowii]
MNKDTPLKGKKQDEQPVHSDGDRSTGCEEPLYSSHACTETSDKDIQHAVVKQSYSNLNSAGANYLSIEKESKHLHELKYPVSLRKMIVFQFGIADKNKITTCTTRKLESSWLLLELWCTTMVMKL